MASYLVAAFEGDVTARLDEIVQACGRQPVGSIQVHRDWSAAAPNLENPGVIVACRAGNWTILSSGWFIGGIVDRIFRDKQLGLNLSRQFGSTVVSAMGCDTSCEYGFRIYRDTNPRYVLVHEAVEENIGDPVPGEPPVTLEEYTEEDVLTVLKLMGIDIEEGLEGKATLLQYTDRR